MPKKEKVGRVTSTKMNQTVVVEIAEYNPHPIYKKIVTTTKNYMAHDPKGIAGDGDEVRIMESRPLSGTKRWVVAEVVNKATKV